MGHTAENSKEITCPEGHTAKEHDRVSRENYAARCTVEGHGACVVTV